MGDAVETLVEMGFSKERAEYAMQITCNAGVQPAMDWLLAHSDEEIPKMTHEKTLFLRNPNNESENESHHPSSSSTSGDGAVVKYIKCSDCGKVFEDQVTVDYHVRKSGHLNYSETTEQRKPLTDEEKKAQLAIVEEKIRKKRIEREVREREYAIERERDRIKSGKDMAEARKRYAEIEMKKAIDQRSREKAEEKAARERVRGQIEADKAARKAREQTQNVSSTIPASSVIGKEENQELQNRNTTTKAYSHTRIQVRVFDGATLTETFNVREQLSAIRVFIQIKTGKDSFGLMTTFPRKVFTDEDYDKPLDVLGLVPSAVLHMTKL